MPDSETKLHVVVHLVGGYVREDSQQPAIAGVYTCAEKAELVRLCAGPGAIVQEVLLDAIPPGYVAAAKELFPARAAKLL